MDSVGDRIETGISPVVGVVLLVVITVLIAGTTMVLASELTSYLNEPAPMVGESSGELTGGSGSSYQIVRLRHISGDPIDVSEIEIQVNACGNSARIVDLPTVSIDEEGDNIIDSRGSKVYGELDDSTDGVWSPGETIGFRIISGGDGCTLNSGDEVDVRVVHKPTSSVIIDETLTAS